MKSDRIFTLNDWIAKKYKSINRHLQYPLVPNAKKSKESNYKFLGINENLYLEILQDSAKIQYRLTENDYETLVDLDIHTTIDSDGLYYCSGCKKIKKYKNRADLIQQHFMDSLKKFQTKSFKKDHFICMVESKTLDILFPLVFRKSEMFKVIITGKLPEKRKSKKDGEKRLHLLPKMKFQLLRAEKVIL
ncbi:MAG: hypothetical protein O9301_15340 [Leptospira sp.]|nr:hypothetical protein [Leptospira sp.]